MIWLDYVVFSLLGLGLVLVVVRLVIGPKLADRVVALDTFNMTVIGIIVFIALLQNSFATKIGWNTIRVLCRRWWNESTIKICR